MSVDFSDYLAIGGFYDDNQIACIDIGPNFPVNPFQFIEPLNFFPLQSYVYAAFYFEFCVHEVESRAAVGSNQFFAVGRKSPSLSWIAVSTFEVERLCVIDKGAFLIPGQNKLFIS